MVVGLLGQSALAANVKVTPLGSHDGKFCSRDRAMVFEDPDGTRILYDAGFTVRGADDPRLGKIDAVLLSQVHGDHLGPSHQPSANAGTCGNPEFSVKDTPDSNTVKIAVGKKSKLMVGAELNTAEQDIVARQYYKANLAVINIGDVFTTGPKEAAYVIDQLVKPTEVIMSHANEVATQDGKAVAGTRTETFMKAVKAPAHVPLSGKTMEFDGTGKCVAGC